MSACGLVVLSPLLLFIIIVVATSSPGGPFFRQKRIGLGGRPFRLAKFRSMTVREGTEDGSFDVGSDVRTTRVGRMLRKTKLDELPQLWNVLIGDMSLVGPRPEVPEWTEVYPDRWKVVLSVRPGITDPASIVFRDEEEILAAAADPNECYRHEILPRKLDLAMEYVARRTLLGDLRIILQTAVAVLRPPRPESAPDEVDR